jgi:hypothetical protein
MKNQPRYRETPMKAKIDRSEIAKRAAETRKRDKEHAAKAEARRLELAPYGERPDLRFTPPLDESIGFKVGQRVTYGGNDHAEIEGFEADGRIVLLRVWGVRTGTQHDGPYECRTAVSWLEIGHVASTNLWQAQEGRLYFQNRDIGGILNTYFSFGIDLDPVYQRGLVWSPEDEQRLLESIFTEVEIGKIVLIQLPFEPDKPYYEVLDGKQRLNTLVRFVTGKIAYRGHIYQRMGRIDRVKFYHTPLAVAISQEPWTLEQKLRYFYRLNVSGRQMDPAHLERIRNMKG